MDLNKTVANIALISALSACGLGGSKTEHLVSQPIVYANEEKEIYLQEPYSRIIARCYASASDAAEACAMTFESRGYTRLTNIPYKTARYDFLTKDTYPTRRWRERELTPRW